jgi:hypothetical protein
MQQVHRHDVRLSVGNFVQFARYETSMIAGFRKYALLYRKTATIQSRDSAREARSAAY